MWRAAPTPSASSSSTSTWRRATWKRATRTRSPARTTTSSPAGAVGLEEAFARGRLLRPNWTQSNSLHLVQALAAWNRAEPEPYQPGPLLAELAAGLRQRPRLVFVLIDGLGVELLERHAAPDGFLRQAFARGGELRSVFPSATASAITTLATARWPAEHAVTGWWIHDPDAALSFLSLPYVERGAEPLAEGRLPELFPVPNWLSRGRRPRRVVQPERIADTPYSRYFRGEETEWRGYADLQGAVDLVLEHCGEAGPGYTYLYLPEVDGAAHRFGPLAEETGEVVRAVEAALTRLQAQVPDGVRLVCSADHGLIEIPPEGRHALTPDDPLRALLSALPSGEPRAPIFHVAEGRQEEFADAFRERFGASWHLLSVAEVEELRLLGPTPLHLQTRARLGDFLALCERPEVIFAAQEPEGGMAEVCGHHGGLAPGEVRIPLLIGA